MTQTCIFSVYCTLIILRHLTLVVLDSLEPLGHRMGQGHKILPRQVSYHNFLRAEISFREGGHLKLFSIQLVFHEASSSQLG
jgi:hypothetical protein